MSKQTIKGVVVKTWVTNGFNGGLPVFKMRIRTESGAMFTMHTGLLTSL